MTKISQHLSREEYESFIQAQNMNEQYKKVFEKWGKSVSVGKPDRVSIPVLNQPKQSLLSSSFLNTSSQDQIQVLNTAQGLSNSIDASVYKNATTNVTWEGSRASLRPSSNIKYKPNMLRGPLAKIISTNPEQASPAIHSSTIANSSFWGQSTTPLHLRPVSALK